jgi:hypothetical protein
MSIAAQFQTKLLCEDIRNELGNKRTLVGVFSGDIIVEKFPATLSLAAYFEYVPTLIGQQRIDFSVYFGNDKLFDFGGVLSVADLSVTALALPRINATIQQPGDFRIEVIAPPSSPDVLITKKVIQGPV